MAIPTLMTNEPPEDILEELVHTLTLTAADPLAAPLVLKFQGLVTEWKQVEAQRVDLVVALRAATSRASYVDEQLDVLVDTLVSVLQKITLRDRDDPLWKVYFGSKIPALFKRPTLGGQLAAMHLWPSALANTPHIELTAIGVKLGTLLPLADDAEEAVALAKQALVEHREVGAWRQLVDKANAERNAAYGFLAGIVHAQPELRLPINWADGFFLHDTSRRGAGARTSADLAELITASEKDLADLRARKVVADDREKADAEAEQAIANKRAELDAATKERRQAEAKEADLKKQLAKTKSKSRSKGKGKKKRV
jgi:hypothetical protein